MLPGSARSPHVLQVRSGSRALAVNRLASTPGL
ncbi:DNA metabolism protein [Pantoea vagans]|nr:DNA metabolism protein [Pantoea vagans]